MIRQEMLDQMVERITARFHPRRVILFGSQATGQATEQSDVDFLVVSDDGLASREQALAIRKSLADFPISCDIIVKNIRDYQRFRDVVNHVVYLADRYGKVIYAR